MEIPLRRPPVLVPGEFLRDDGIAGVLDSARDELMTDGVPGQALVSAELDARQTEQLAPHAAEAPNPTAVLRAEHERVRIVPKPETALREFFLQPF